MPNQSSDFVKTVRNALNHYDDPAWLEQHSPLISPYFLSQYIERNPTDSNLPHGRGKLLRQLLYDAAVELWDGPLPDDRTQLIERVEQWRGEHGNKGGVYYFYLLELRFFRRYFSSHTRPRNTSLQISRYLLVSEARFYVHIKAAIIALAEKVIRLVRPTLRLEQPKPLSEGDFVGRQDSHATIIHQLKANQGVMVSGMGGMGKTTLGEMIYKKWEESPAFWYTIRPYINDDVNSLFYALAHFLKTHGATTLWSQLMADGGRDQARLLGYLENDLMMVKPLLCFDEIDRLLSREPGAAHPSQMAIVEVLERLIRVTPTLLIGQYPIMDTPHHYTLTGLNAGDSFQLIERIASDIEPTVSRKWHQLTDGNPRLLHLCATLHQKGETVSSELDLRGAFERLWRRLSGAEQAVLAELSVYLTPAPVDVWKAEEATIQTLIQRQLLKEDSEGGIAIAPLWRLYLYERFLMLETREACHRKAADVRLQLAEYTASSYHFAQAGEEAQALNIWYEHRYLEIERGFIPLARRVFLELVSATKMPSSLKKKLTIVRNLLFATSGDFDEIIRRSELRPITNADSLDDVIIDRQEARTESILGNTSTALERYEHALKRLSKILELDTEIRNHQGRILLDQLQLGEARQKAKQVEATCLQLKAEIARRGGDFEQAETFYKEALDSAESDKARSTSIHHDLAILLSQQSKIKRAKYHAEQAHNYYIEIGNRVMQETIQMEIAGMYLQAEQFEKVVEYGEPPLKFFRNVRHQAALSVLLNILAQAYFEIGNVQKAREYTNEVLREEEQGQQTLAYYTLGRIHVHNGDCENALKVFNEGLRITNEQEDIYMQAYLLRERSKLHKLENDDIRANADREAALELFKQMGLDDEIDK